MSLSNHEISKVNKYRNRFKPFYCYSSTTFSNNVSRVGLNSRPSEIYREKHLNLTIGLQLLFFKEQQEQFVHSHSVMWVPPVALLSQHSLFKMIRSHKVLNLRLHHLYNMQIFSITIFYLMYSTV